MYDLIIHSEHPADSTIDTFFRSHRYLGSHDRRFIAETVYGMLRYKKRIEWLCQTPGQRSLESSDNPVAFLHCLVYRSAVANDEVGALVHELDADPVEKESLLLFLTALKEQNDKFRSKLFGALRQHSRALSPVTHFRNG